METTEIRDSTPVMPDAGAGDIGNADNIKRINLLLERGNFKGLSHHTGIIRAMVGEIRD